MSVDEANKDTTRSNFETAMKDAKNWSDFLAFHVRIYFVFLIALVALLPAIVAFANWRKGGPLYDITQFYVEIAVFLFTMSMAGVMFWKIAKLLFCYFRAKRLAKAFALAITIVIVAIDLFIAAVIMRVSYTQALNLNGIKISEMDGIGKEVISGTKPCGS